MIAQFSKYLLFFGLMFTAHHSFAESPSSPSSEISSPLINVPHEPQTNQMPHEFQIPDFKDDTSSQVFPASQLPIEESPDKFTSELLNMLITLGMLVAVIFALSYILKRMLTVKTQQENYKSTIKVLEKRSLSPKAALYLVEVYNRTLVIAESPNGFSCMTTFDDIEEEAETETPPPKDPKAFEKILNQTK